LRRRSFVRTALSGAALTTLATMGSLTVLPASVQAQQLATASAAGGGVEVTPDYVIGPGDVLAIRFWRRDDVSADVTVRPDGRISLLLLDDVEAAGLTPEQLRDRITDEANKLFEDARVTVIVREVNSRNVYITGMVARPGPYPLRDRLTVLQLIAMAGGLRDFANGDDITITRTVNGKEVGYRFNYNDVRNRRRLEQNIELKPGDTVIVP
jgi:polysaccharide export outer membrane protein